MWNDSESALVLSALGFLELADSQATSLSETTRRFANIPAAMTNPIKVSNPLSPARYSRTPGDLVTVKA